MQSQIRKPDGGVDNAGGNNPIWERGSLYKIYTIIDNKKVQWPSELMFRVKKFVFEDDETIQKLDLALWNGDYLLTQISDEIAAGLQKQSGEMGLTKDQDLGPFGNNPYNANSKESVYTYRKPGSQSDNATKQGTPLAINYKERIEYRHLFELGALLVVEYGYPGYMSPARYIKVVNVTGFSEISVTAYEIQLGLMFRAESATWTIYKNPDGTIGLPPDLSNVITGSDSRVALASVDTTQLEKEREKEAGLDSSNKGELIQTTTEPSTVPVDPAKKATIVDVTNGIPLSFDFYTKTVNSTASPQEVSSVGLYLGDQYEYDESISEFKDGFLDKNGNQKELKFKVDSDGIPHIGLVSSIARRYGFKAVVQERYTTIETRGVTESDPPTIIRKEKRFTYAQMGASDFGFLQKIAQAVGYLFWIELDNDYLEFAASQSVGTNYKQLKPRGTLYFMPRMYWQAPYSEYKYAQEMSAAEYARVTSNSSFGGSLFDRIIDFGNPEMDSREKSTFFGGYDVNPLTGQIYSGKNLIRDGFRFKMLGLDWYDFNAINSAFEEKVFNRVGIPADQLQQTDGEKKPADAKMIQQEYAESLPETVTNPDTGEVVSITSLIKPTVNEAYSLHQQVADQGTQQDRFFNIAKDLRVQALEAFADQEEKEEEVRGSLRYLANLTKEHELLNNSLNQTSPTNIVNLRLPSADEYDLVDKFTGNFFNDLEQSMKTTMKVIGDPFLRSKMVISVRGVGVYDGKWYIKKVTHDLSNGYLCTSDLQTNRTAYNKDYTRETLEGNLNDYEAEAAKRGEKYDLISAKTRMQDALDSTSALEKIVQQQKEALKEQEKQAKETERVRKETYTQAFQSVLGETIRFMFPSGTEKTTGAGAEQSWQWWYDKATSGTMIVDGAPDLYVSFGKSVVDNLKKTGNRITTENFFKNPQTGFNPGVSVVSQSEDENRKKVIGLFWFYLNLKIDDGTIDSGRGAGNPYTDAMDQTQANIILTQLDLGFAQDIRDKIKSHIGIFNTDYIKVDFGVIKKTEAPKTATSNASKQTTSSTSSKDAGEAAQQSQTQTKISKGNAANKPTAATLTCLVRGEDNNFYVIGLTGKGISWRNKKELTGTDVQVVSREGPFTESEAKALFNKTTGQKQDYTTDTTNNKKKIPAMSSQTTNTNKDTKPATVKDTGTAIINNVTNIAKGAF